MIFCGLLSQICEIFELRYLEKYAFDQHEICRGLSGAQMDFVSGPALQSYNSRWRRWSYMQVCQNIKQKIKSKMAAAAILDFCTNSNNSVAD